MSEFFTVIHRSEKSRARVGEIHTAHGVIKTPAFVPVATKATVKSLLPQLLAEIKTQVAFVNTYHLVTHPGADVIAKAGGVHSFSKLPIPLMSDSGGFQVFSLAKSTHESRRASIFGEEDPLVEKISEDGVRFRSTYDGSVVEFTPEKSIHYQKQIGADLIMAFDECTYLNAPYDYTKKAMERTHRWLERCIDAFIVNRSSLIEKQKKKGDKRPTKYDKQYLYGIIQGGMYEDLRKESAKFIVSQQPDGIAVGGVSVGESKQEMRQQFAWVADYLPSDKPVHALGIGHADDIIDLVKYGVDSFDCVEPTRLARMGLVYKPLLLAPPAHRKHNVDITRSIYKRDLSVVDEGCECYVCQNFTKAYLHHLFKQKELLGYTLATYHNLWVMERFMDGVRERIADDQL